jgi:microcystin-dependent protein
MSEDNIVNIVIGIVILALFVWSYKKSKKEGFFATEGPQVLSGYNNILLTNPQGDMSSIQFPSGMIMMWNGEETNIPQGWAVCDGKNGTPDLRGRFLIGANTYSNRKAGLSQRDVKSTGGDEMHTLTEDEMPSHEHSGVVTNVGYNGPQMAEGRSHSPLYGKTSSTGGNKPHNNMPPYYAIIYLMKL